MEDCEKCGSSVRKTKAYVASGYGRSEEDRIEYFLCPSCFALTMQCAMTIRPLAGVLAMMLSDYANQVEDLEPHIVSKLLIPYLETIKSAQ